MRTLIPLGRNRNLCRNWFSLNKFPTPFTTKWRIDRFQSSSANNLHRFICRTRLAIILALPTGGIYVTNHNWALRGKSSLKSMAMNCRKSGRTMNCYESIKIHGNYFTIWNPDGWLTWLMERFSYRKMMSSYLIIRINIYIYNFLSLLFIIIINKKEWNKKINK